MQFEGSAGEREARAVLRAWASIDQLGLIKLRTKERTKTRLTAEVDLSEAWPAAPSEPRDVSTPRQLVGRVYVSCFGVDELEKLLGRALAADTRFKETVGGSGGKSKTCRAFFNIDQTGTPVPESFGFSQLPDLLNLIQHSRQQGADPSAAAFHAIEKLASVENKLRKDFEAAIVRAGDAASTEVVRLVIEALSANDAEWPWLSANKIELTNWVHTRWVENSEEEDLEFSMSFFHDDLLDVVNKPFANGVLEKYLFGDTANRHDMTKSGVLMSLLDPMKLPRASWPTSYSPRLSQQLSTTIALNEMADGDLMSVNGPPGTGKTSSLKDLYSNIVHLRAHQMVKFEKPEDAFVESQAAVGTYPRSLYAVDSSLTGFEMLLASSTNKAVENVTREFPSVDEVADVYRERFGYFRDEANWRGASNSSNRDVDAQDKDLSAREFNGSKWGFVCGIAGNSSNTRELLAQLGIFEPAGTHNGLLRRISEDVDETQLRERWASVRSRFTDASARVESLIELRSKAWSKYQAIRPAEEKLHKKRAAVNSAIERCKQHRRSVDVAIEAQRAALRRLGAAKNELRESSEADVTDMWPFSDLPKWLMGVLARRRLKNRVKSAQRRETAADKKVRKLLIAHEKKRSAIETLKKQHADLAAELAVMRADVAEFGDWAIDDAWFSRSHEERELGCVWIDAELHNAQVELFAVSLEVHEVFVRCVGKQVAANLRTFRDLMLGGLSPDEKLAAAVPVWQTLFLVVPMISTTFASVSRLLKYLPRETLGYLIVDEGGQALPYAAVGALAKSQRAVVVGDPFQTEPIVSLPDALVEALMRVHNADKTKSPLNASVQTMADAAAKWGAERHGQWVGAPLYVHQRCLDPMFSMSNKMVYQDMVYGRSRVATATVEALPESQWFHVPHRGNSHWNDDDWKVIESKILVLFEHLGFDELPSIAMISPFNEVVDQLRTRCDAFARRRRGAPKDSSVRRAKVSAGTVHKYQGEEREVVVLVLGGNKDQPGAIGWATEKPNLLNVAVTRAQDRLYVVGDLNNWSASGCARQVYKEFELTHLH